MDHVGYLATTNAGWPRRVVNLPVARIVVAAGHSRSLHSITRASR
jgi:hypothetical protein